MLPPCNHFSYPNLLSTFANHQTSHKLRAGEINSSGSREGAARPRGLEKRTHQRYGSDSQDGSALWKRQDALILLILKHKENLLTIDAIKKYRVGLGGEPSVNFLAEKQQEGSTRPARAKGQTYQASELYEIMNVESVFGGLYSEGAPSRATRACCPEVDDRSCCTYASTRLVPKVLQRF